MDRLTDTEYFNDLEEEQNNSRQKQMESILVELMNLRISKLICEFNEDLESQILETAGEIRMLPNNFPEGRAFAFKRLADCYFANERFHDALDYYKEALKSNDKLPVKRRVEELKIMTGEWM